MKKLRAANAASWVGLIGLGTLLLACGQAGPEQGSENINRVGEALVTPDKIYTDGSGQLSILVRTCDWQGSFTPLPHCSYCAVDPDWVLVGGGAEIQTSGTGSTAAKIVGSFPYPYSLSSLNPDFGAGTETCIGNPPPDTTTDYLAWAARSNGGTNHKVRAYAIGIKISGYTAADLRGSMFWSDTTSFSSLTPTITSPSVGAGALLGGGANMLGNAHAYLTESRPLSDASSWIGTGRTSDGNIAGIKVYYLPSFNNFGLFTKVRSATGSSGTGSTSASVSTPYPWVTTSIGGKGLSGANYLASRTLRGLLPFASSTQGVADTTAPEIGQSINGATTAYSLNTYVDGGSFAFWNNNVIRSADFSTSLSRPSGTAPVRLQESTTVPNGSQTSLRWHLEPMAGGRVRIRNANPSSPESGECAFWSGSGNAVNVGPCNSTNAYLWTYSVFQFKNVATNTCLNPTGVNNANLNLATCATNGSQLFTLSAAGWPP